MKKSWSVLVALLFACTAQAQSNDPVIMTINGVDVPRSEFEYSFNKNNSEGVIDKKSIDEYVDLFINYKLKVAAAIDAHLDTMTSYKKEFVGYRDQQLYSSFYTDADVEKEAMKVYESTKTSIGPNGLIRPAHIFVHLPQNATPEEQAKKKALADSLYDAVKAGADFAELAKKHSEDIGTSPNGGLLPWVGPNQMVKEFEEAAYKLNVGEMSEVVLSSYGYHIILMKERKQLEPYEELRDDIMKFIEQRNIRESIAKQNIDSLAKERNISPEQLMDERAEELSAKDLDTKYLIQEYHDGLLLYEISNKNVWDAAAKDTVGLKNYFEHNKKKYAWDEPRFKGIAYHTRDKADIKAVKKCIKNVPFDQWAPVLKNMFNNDSVLRIRAEKGIFKKGDNALVDKIIFKQKDAEPKPVKDYPYDDAFGKVLKKGPEDYMDVQGLVVADYQEVLEKEWIKDLRSKYTFSVNKDVLKTVNVR